jgi:hypothetical protein
VAETGLPIGAPAIRIYKPARHPGG